MEVLEKRRGGRPRDEALTARREEEIVAAAQRMFARDGYPNTDLQVLADELGVGKGTLYRYFPSKEELFLAAVDRGMVRLHQQVEEQTRDVIDPLERIRAAVRAFLSFFDANPEVVELLIQERAVFRDREKPTYIRHREANIGPWEELLRGLVRAKRIRNIPVSRITSVLSNLLYGTIFTQHFNRKQASLDDKTEDILDVAFFGLLSDAERTRPGNAPGPR